MRFARSSVALALPLLFTLVACGSESEAPESGFSLPPRKEAPPGTGAGFEDGKADGDGSTLGACAESATPVKREPSSIMLLVDRSGSMHIKLPSGESRWQATKTGLADLVRALPSSAHVGAMMFPQGDAPVNAYCGIDASINDVKCSSGWPEPSSAMRCNPGTYKAGVESRPLVSTQISAIDAYVAASDAEFYWGTPLAPAVSAAVSAQKASTVKGARSVVLLTDGNPTSCDGSGISNAISNVVDAAAAGSKDGVRTFVIGVIDDARQAARAENLSPVAKAGGTARSATCEADSSCFYAVNAATFAADMKKVFEEIGGQAFDCKFNVPEPKPGAVADPDTLNVEVSGPGGASYVIKRDMSKSDGWDYLPGGKQLEVYGDACKRLSGEGLNVKVVVGCKTQVR